MMAAEETTETEAVPGDGMDPSRFARPVVTQVAGLFASILICFAAAGLGAAVTTPQIRGWYATINKPSWNPPDWVFGPVWTVLYLMMAVAAWLVWRRSSFRMDRIPLAVFAVQLALNSLWSVLFFGMQQPGLAAAEILLLVAMILATVVVFWRRSPVAGSLLLPYLIWVSFASVLNLSIWQLNQ